VAESPITDEQMTKLAEIHDTVHDAQKKMAALRGELELEPDQALKSFISTLSRKSHALGHVRDDLQGIPRRVAEDRQRLAVGSAQR
jgi:hypothetical protein